ncbi:unnamed protein product [Urochloa humidicola]
MIPVPDGFQCTKDGCPSRQFEWKYKIPFIVADELRFKATFHNGLATSSHLSQGFCISVRTRDLIFLLIREHHRKQEVLPLLNTQLSTQEPGTSSDLVTIMDLPELMTISSKKTIDEDEIAAVKVGIVVFKGYNVGVGG